MRPASRRLGALLGVALVGVLVAVGLGIAGTAGPTSGLVYTALALVVLALAARRGRSLLTPPAPPPDGRTCDCCTATQLDPVKILP
jgi:membrane protease YdiL (CAAX protease family)